MSNNRKEEIVFTTLELAAQKRACECFHEYDRRQNRDKKAFAL